MVDKRGRREAVRVCNDAAQAAGVAPGMARSAAEALAARLWVRPREPAREQRTLEALAAWAQQFTPCVVIDSVPALLLEIGGCLHYFGGLPALTTRAVAGLAELGHAASTGCAPTPQAALWLARCGVSSPVTDSATLAARLNALPLALLADEPALPARTVGDLVRLGARQLGDVARLPPAGLARRFGPALPALLDRAWGRAPDPRLPYVPPEIFERRIELGWPADKAEALVFVAHRLLVELTGFLCGRGAGVQTVELWLAHEDAPSTRVTLGFGRPTRHLEDMGAILRERLASLALPHPTHTLTLRAATPAPLDAEPRDLFDTAPREAQLQHFAARLVARLGEGVLTGIACVADHRPERASQLAPPGSASPDLSVGPRPAWLLPEPTRLPLRDERPWRGEPLICQGRAERIESGWWDAAPIARDYYIAETPSGKRYWIFQEHGSLAWFLHGIFA